MKNLILFFLFCLLYSSTGISQVNWNDYKEPDGTLTRLFLDPDFSFFSDDDDSRTDLSLVTRLNSTSVKDRSIMTFGATNSFSIDADKDKTSSIKDNRLVNNFEAFSNYRYYIGQRRGLFIEGGATLVRSDTKINDITEASNSIFIPFNIGYGRLENISTVYQAIRINNQMKQGNLSSQESLFALADVMRQQDYNNTLDARMRGVDQMMNYLDAMQDLGYSLSGNREIANAIDAYRFERPFAIYNGFIASAGLVYNKATGADGKIDLVSNAEYHKAINEKFHAMGSLNTNNSLSNSGNYLMDLRSRLSYLPSARTRITTEVFWQMSKFTGGFVVKEANYSGISLTGIYFVSPQLSLNARANFSNRDETSTGTEFDRTAFSTSFGLRYYIM